MIKVVSMRVLKNFGKEIAFQRKKADMRNNSLKKLSKILQKKKVWCRYYLVKHDSVNEKICHDFRKVVFLILKY